jgi:aldose 1-epimerase
MSLRLTSADGRVQAAVDPHGGGLRKLLVDGCAIVESYPAGERPPHAAGAVLFPWPNRTRDGRWSAHGTEHQLIIDEPGHQNANHGLVREQEFETRYRARDVVTVRTEVKDRPGYPFHVSLSIEYRLVEDGLRVRSQVRNLGGRPAPFALGFHPYLRIGSVPTAQLMPDVRAATVLELDDRLIPVGAHAVAGSPDELADRPLAATVLNHCYGGFTDVHGTIVHRLRAADGRTVDLRADSCFGWLQVYTCPQFPRAGAAVTELAFEPMTAPPNSLRSGADLIWIAPGADWSATWSLHFLAPQGRTPATGPADAGVVNGRASV